METVTLPESNLDYMTEFKKHWEQGVGIALIIVVFAVSIAVVASKGCAAVSVEREQVSVKIVDVYREFKIGRPSGTTVVAMPDGSRVKLDGRLGKKGEVITVTTINGRPVNK